MSKEKKEEISKEEMKDFLDFLAKICKEGLDVKVLEDTQKATDLVEKIKEYFENAKSEVEENEDLFNDCKITVMSSIAIGGKVVFFNIQGNNKGRDAIKEQLE